MKKIDFEQLVKGLMILGAAISFMWGVLTYIEARKIESTKPFLEKQLLLYSEATRITAVISTSKDNSTESINANERFWKLYYGELAMVENRDVEAAMKSFGDALKAGASKPVLQNLSLRLARSCRYSLDKSWGINAWTNPDIASMHTAN